MSSKQHKNTFLNICFQMMLLLATACFEAPKPDLHYPLNVYISSLANEKEIENVKNACADWNDVLGTEIFIYKGFPTNGGEGECNSVYIYPGIRGSNQNAKVQASTSFGSCYAMIEIYNHNANNIKTLFQHELGHVMGIPHNETDSDDIMYFQSPLQGELSQWDIDMAMENDRVSDVVQGRQQMAPPHHNNDTHNQGWPGNVDPTK